MCQRLIELKAAMQVYSTGFDPAAVTCADAASVVADAAAIEHMAATIKALAAARAAEAQGWKAGGFRSAAEELARTTGSTVTGAREALLLGRRLGDQPEVAEAARQGRLSPTQATVIADAVAANPDAASELVDAAEARGSVADLQDRCAAVKAASIDLEARRAAIRRRRRVRGWTDDGGEWHLVANGNPEDGAQIMAAIGPEAEELFRAARKSGRREHPDAYLFDALVQLAIDATSPGPMAPADLDLDRDCDCDVHTAGPTAPDSAVHDRADRREPGTPGRSTPGPTTNVPGRDDPDQDHRDLADATPAGPAGPAEPVRPGPADPASDDHARRRQRPPPRPRPRRGAPVKLLIRVDLTTLMRGFPADGETCELVGYGPISLSAVKQLVADGDPFVAAILTKGKQLAGVAHLGRQPTAHQRSYLQWIYPTCAAQGCPQSADHCQIDHRIDWSRTHITLIDWLDALCRHHHNLKTRQNWALVEGIGKRPFVSPTDPRHPHAPQSDHRRGAP